MTSPKHQQRRELWELIKLSGPLAFVQACYQLTSVVDTAFAGRLGDAQIGAAGIGSMVFFVVACFGIGIGIGLDPLVAQCFGANERYRARRSLWQGLYVVAGATLPLSLAIALLVTNLEIFGIVPALSEQTRVYVWARLPSLFPLLAAVTLRSYLQAAHRTRPIVWASIWTNLFNVAADFVLGFGDDGLETLGLPRLGLPAYGLEGIAWATVIAQSAQMAVLGWATRSVDVAPAHNAPGVRRFDPKLCKNIIALGAPIGMQLMAEVGVFGAVQVLMGRISVVASASHQVALMLASLSFSACVGIGAATSVQVGRAIGRGDVGQTRRAGIHGMLLGGGFMAAIAVLLWTVPHSLARILTSEAEVIAAAVLLVRIAGAFQIVDGVQAVAAGALRGAGITRWTLIANLVAHWAIGLPLGIWLTFGLEIGPAGLWWGLVAGLALVAAALAIKFLKLSRKRIERLQLGER